MSRPSTSRKSAIESAALAGLEIHGGDVARISRSGRVLTMRHRWHDDSIDGRISHAVARAAQRLARAQAAKIGASVEIRSADDFTIAVIGVES